MFDHVGYPWTRINTEDFATNVALTLEPTSGTGTIFVRDSGREVSLSDVKAVWYRKPEPTDLSHFEIEKEGLDYVEGEFNEVLLGIYGLLKDVFWVNNPLASRIIHRKLHQLRVARSLGLATPRTIITNVKQDALNFAEEIGGDLALKSLSSFSVWARKPNETIQYGLFTRRVTREELRSVADKIAYLPTIYQEYIEKAYEIRTTIVGHQCFSCRIDSQSTEFGKDDFRIATHSAEHTAYKLPEIVERRLFKYMVAMDINFGAFDIIRSTAGEYVFLECNPNGQWLWVEKKINAGIGIALAHMLLGSCGIKHNAVSEANAS